MEALVGIIFPTPFSPGDPWVPLNVSESTLFATAAPFLGLAIGSFVLVLVVCPLFFGTVNGATGGGDPTVGSADIPWVRLSSVG